MDVHEVLKNPKTLCIAPLIEAVGYASYQISTQNYLHALVGAGCFVLVAILIGAAYSVLTSLLMREHVHRS